MAMVLTLVLALQMLSALAMIGLILVQHGKGADMGAAFGSGSSGSVFGATGSANFLSRTTAGLAAVFFVTSLALTWFASGRSSARNDAGIMGTVQQSKDAAKAGVVPKGEPAKATDVPKPAQDAPRAIRDAVKDAAKSESDLPKPVESAPK